METALIQISPMIPAKRPQQPTPPYGRFFLACVCAVLILAIIGGAALCATDQATHTARELEEAMRTLDLQATELMTEGMR